MGEYSLLSIYTHVAKVTIDSVTYTPSASDA